MLKNYSYKMIRDKAKELKIGEELRKLNNDKLNVEFDNFKEGWKKFCDFLKEKQNTPKKGEYLLKYLCRPPMEPKYINEEDQIANVLNDNGEFLYGMNLAAAYEKFIDGKIKFYQILFQVIIKINCYYILKMKFQKKFMFKMLLLMKLFHLI